MILSPTSLFELTQDRWQIFIGTPLRQRTLQQQVRTTFLIIKFTTYKNIFCWDFISILQIPQLCCGSGSGASGSVWVLALALISLLLETLRLYLNQHSSCSLVWIHTCKSWCSCVQTEPKKETEPGRNWMALVLFALQCHTQTKQTEPSCFWFYS